MSIWSSIGEGLEFIPRENYTGDPLPHLSPVMVDVAIAPAYHRCARVSLGWSGAILDVSELKALIGLLQLAVDTLEVSK